MDVDYVAWQADHDAYGFSGQTLCSVCGELHVRSSKHWDEKQWLRIVSDEDDDFDIFDDGSCLGRPLSSQSSSICGDMWAQTAAEEM